MRFRSRPVFTARKDTVGTVTAATEGLDVTVYPLPGTEVVPEETDETDAEEADDDADDRSSTSTRRPSQSQNQNTGGGTQRRRRVRPDTCCDTAGGPTQPTEPEQPSTEPSEPEQTPSEIPEPPESGIGSSDAFDPNNPLQENDE